MSLGCFSLSTETKKCPRRNDHSGDFCLPSRRTSFPGLGCPYDNYDNKLNPPFGFPFNQPNRDVYAMRNKDNTPVCYEPIFDRIWYTSNVNEVSKTGQLLLVYPNPSQGSFKINLTGTLTVFCLSPPIGWIKL